MSDVTDPLLLVVTFLVSAGAGILSGMAGGGSGFIIGPYLLLIGIPAHLATATAKMNEVGVNVSSILAMRTLRQQTLVTHTGFTVEAHSPQVKRQLFIAILMAISLCNVCIAAWVIPQLTTGGIQYIIAGLLLLMIPTLFIDKKAFQPGSRSRQWKRWGYGSYTAVSLIQAIFGMGIGMFISMVLMYMFGIPVAEANDIKRRVMLVQATVLLALLLIQQAVLLPLGLAAMAGAMISGHLGTKIGVKKGSLFIKRIMAVVMAISAISILVQL